MTTTPSTSPARGAVVGRALLILAALGCAGAAGAAISQLGMASSQEVLHDSWRAFGLVIFAALFALVTWRPTGYPGVLELAFVHSLAMALMAVSQLETAEGAWVTLILSGLLVLAVLAAYVLLGCHRAWRGARPRDAAADTPALRRGAGQAPGGQSSPDQTRPQETLESTRPLPTRRNKGSARATDAQDGEAQPDPGAERPPGPGGIPRPPRS